MAYGESNDHVTPRDVERSLITIDSLLWGRTTVYIRALYTLWQYGRLS